MHGPIIAHSPEEQVEQFVAAVLEFGEYLQNRLPVVTQSLDVTEAMIYLCGESGRCVSGVTLPVDAASTV